VTTRAAKHRLYQRGLTLIELLVTMVLLGFVVALMSGAFVQIAQMLRISSEHGNGFSGRWTQSRALQDIVANLVADPSLEEPVTGTASRLTITSLAIPPVASGTAQRATLELRVNNASSGESTTVLELPTLTGALPRTQDKPFELARYNGRLRFVYLDSQGLEHRQWPALGTTQPEKMPVAVGLRDEAEQNALVQIAHYEGALSAKQGNGLAGFLGVKR
jgi:general secretion pathway protein J